jgi:hypothetical protein
MKKPHADSSPANRPAPTAPRLVLPGGEPTANLIEGYQAALEDNLALAAKSESLCEGIRLAAALIEELASALQKHPDDYTPLRPKLAAAAVRFQGLIARCRES